MEMLPGCHLENHLSVMELTFYFCDRLPRYLKPTGTRTQFSPSALANSSSDIVVG